MGKFLKKFKRIAEKVDDRAKNTYLKENPNKNYNKHLKHKQKETILDGVYDDSIEDDNFNDFDRMDDYDNYGVGIQPAQKPESFHHFILENQYKDLEKSIRGYKDVYNKTTREWETKRKSIHCFTDEEAEEILRTAQSHLATDIKLSVIDKSVFGEMMMAIYKRLDELFYSIAEYRYGRYSHNADGKPIEGGYQKEYEMKLQNRKIFLELWSRVQANYSRAIGGSENKATHQSVSAQESLQSSDRLEDRNRRYS